MLLRVCYDTLGLLCVIRCASACFTISNRARAFSGNRVQLISLDATSVRSAARLQPQCQTNAISEPAKERVS